MATLTNRKNVAVLIKEICEGHLRSNMAQNSSVPGSQEDYVTQVFEKTERRVTKSFQKILAEQKTAN